MIEHAHLQAGALHEPVAHRPRLFPFRQGILDFGQRQLLAEAVANLLLHGNVLGQQLRVVLAGQECIKEVPRRKWFSADAETACKRLKNSQIGNHQMNDGFNQPQNPANRRSRRRKRNFSNQSQGGQQNQGRHGGSNRNRNNRSRGQRRGGVFVGPMDHSYRNQGNGAGGPGRFHNGLGSTQPAGDLDPLPPREDAPTRIFAFVDDLFFLAKIQEVGRKLNVKVEFVKSDKEIDEKVGEAPEEKPSLVIVDLNSNTIKPISIISKLKSKYKKTTSIVGFLSHVQGDLKVKAQNAGCDVVMPRSAFSQTLPSLLRRHGALEEPEENFNKA